MITLGLDPHPHSHTIAALDSTGATLGCLTVPNTPEGHAQLYAFGQQYGERQWAVEGAGNTFITPFIGMLLGQAERVINIPANLTSQYRARRGRKKNDEVDAQNAARALASFCGAAPVERGSGQNRRMQLNPGGNRRLNWALHIIAVVRLKHDGGRSRALVDRLRQQGKSQRASLRILKTYIARDLFTVMRRSWPPALGTLRTES